MILRRAMRARTGLALLALALVVAGATVPADGAVPTRYDLNYRADLAHKAAGTGAVADACWLQRDGFEAPGTPRWQPPPLSVMTDAGYRVTVNRHTVTIADPGGGNRIEHWGDPHENLNGKHIKDWGGAVGWDGERRTILLGDGSKVTLEASGAQGLVLRTSVYDGTRNVQIENCFNAIVHASDDAFDSATREQLQYDGETSSFTTDPATDVALYDTIGNEDAGFNFVASPQRLGESGGFANPNQVRDYFDDPRLGHT